MNKNCFIKLIVLVLSFFIIMVLSLVIKSSVFKFYEKEDILLIKDDNLYKVINNGELSIFDLEYQEFIDKKIDKLLKKKYKFENPLMILNPYGTNTLGVNIYFNTNEELEISYTISVENEYISDFSRVLKNDSEDNFTKEHKYQIIGLIPGEVNNLKLIGTNKKGEKVEKILKVDMSTVECDIKSVLGSINGESKENLKDGLFVAFGISKPNYIYDNDGILRAILQVEQTESKRIIFYNGDLYYRYDTNVIGVIDRLGKIKKEYVFDGFEMHHDYIMDEQNKKLIALCSSYDIYEDRIFDVIVIIDMNSGKIESVIDMKDLLYEMFEIAYNSSVEQGKFIASGLDWIHLNSISLVDGKDDIILSSRELSSIIYLEDIYFEPNVKYLIADEAIYEGTSYSKLVLDKVGDFVCQASQHTVEFLTDSSLKEAQYYLIMFNNNFGENYTRRDFPWHKFPGTGTFERGEKSMYYKYLIDEHVGTYELVDKFDVEYSSIVSNVQQLNDNLLIASGNSYCFGEYDKNGVCIKKYEVDNLTEGAYRVYKYDFNGVWFK